MIEMKTQIFITLEKMKAKTHNEDEWTKVENAETMTKVEYEGVLRNIRMKEKSSYEKIKW